MKTHYELQLLEACLSLKEDPGTVLIKYKLYSALFSGLGILCGLALIPTYLGHYEPNFEAMAVMFLGGVSLASGIWLGLSRHQAKVFPAHLSEASIKQRIQEIKSIQSNSDQNHW